MTDPRSNAPRRYFVDAGGRRVLIGLTLEETFEFETIDNQPAIPSGEDGYLTGGRTVLRPDPDEQRWQELYAKHEGAWKVWMAQNRAEQSGGFSLF